MEASPLTASAVVDFATRLEELSLGFYSRLAERFPEEREMLLSFAEESKKNKVLVIRTYQETITDALEAGFSFKGLDLSQYALDTALPEDIGRGDALQLAIGLEEQSIRFYADVAERSGSLLATIPRAFRQAGQRRRDRQLKLRALSERSKPDRRD